ncbi:MAG: aminoglycoside phosphotransferase family protein [Candidatus Nanopelagicales bacterium]
MRIRLPAGLEERRELGPDWGHWLDRLPRLFVGMLQEWSLTREGEDLWHGFCSLVAPVISADGTRAVLKLTFDGNSESLHEGLVLQRWHGNGAVRLLRADPHRRAVLLERLHRRDLTGVSDLEACQIVAGLYPRLHQPALAQLATLTSCVSNWLDDLDAQPRAIPIPPRYRDQARSLGRDLASDPASVGRVIHGDLHYENVLATPLDLRPDRGAWLAIDPKPMSGDPHYEVAPMLWNRYEELARDVRHGIRQRLRTLVEHGGLDEDRARAWVVVRMILNANWSVQDAQRTGRDLSPQERAWVTRCIAITKAVQD